MDLLADQRPVLYRVGRRRNQEILGVESPMMKSTLPIKPNPSHVTGPMTITKLSKVISERPTVRKGPITFNDQYRNSPRRPIRIAASMVQDLIRGEAKVSSLCVVIWRSEAGRGHVGTVGTVRKGEPHLGRSDHLSGGNTRRGFNEARAPGKAITANLRHDQVF
jgi:hypothetical protein